MNGCPALVIPVVPDAPILAWSSITLREMYDEAYEAGHHYKEIMKRLVSLINISAVDDDKREMAVLWMADVVKLIIRSAAATRTISYNITKNIDPDRAGIVMFRY